MSRGISLRIALRYAARPDIIRVVVHVNLDDVDRSIIGELQDDGRRPFREIARSVGVSEATVRSRMRRLDEAGALRIVAFADPLKLGNAELALLFLRVENDRHDPVIAELEQLPEVSYLSSILGRWDICAQVVVRDTAALESLVRSSVGGIDGVLEVESLLETRVHKLRFEIPAIVSDGPTNGSRHRDQE
jgi:Lrp/AsnC family transcriptional regulator, regulator for asnA, asnC and gidA